ncbi:hypothetical protein BBO_01009 [Beauveria brongniartii RCEF 3172]|uniref:Uncharacterized protein n=1 Tax=Beauveria brongniartii RCEF 3172 TaxID=1081107 RepID=A0A167K0P1_9HYPO|nr:hypothetical protein BBO_01009 [Beauveria brongniartii RCEF 3172]
MNAITQTILNKSKLEIDLIKITNATESSFLMSLKGKTTKIGVAKATVSAMTVDLVGPRGAFGRLDVPEIKMGAFGADITIVEQRIAIIDMEAFKAFVASIMQDEQLVLRLEKGQATVKSMGMTSTIAYNKVLNLRGLKSLETTLLKVEADDNGVKSIISMLNPSQFEVDLGTVIYEVQGKDGRRIGEQKGATYVSRGESSLALHGFVEGEVSSGETRFVGVDVEEENWLKQIMGSIEVVVTV